MKKETHPEYVDCTVICSCGETFQTRSTKAELKIELCSKCHPFFTGKQKLVDSGGRVERFQKKYGKMLEEQEAAREAGAEGEAEEEGAEGEAEAAAGEEAADEPPSEEAAAETPEAEESSEAEAPAAEEGAAEEPPSEEAEAQEPAEEAPGQDENEPDTSTK